MIPSVLSSQVKKGVEDFLKATFPVSTPFFHGVMDRFLGEDGGVFKGPYLSIKLPYRTSSIGPDFFPGIPLFFPPYLHQEQAFRRLAGEQPVSPILATGTGSGKTECFLYSILDCAPCIWGFLLCHPNCDFFATINIPSQHYLWF